jgi:hypothetical protein
MYTNKKYKSMIRTISSSYLSNFSTTPIRYGSYDPKTPQYYDNYCVYITIDTWSNFITTLENMDILNKDRFIFPDKVSILNTVPSYKSKYRSEYLIPDKFQFNYNLTLHDFGLVQLHKNMEAGTITMFNTYPISIPNNLYNASYIKIIDDINDGDMEFYYESYLKKRSDVFNYKFDNTMGNKLTLITKK